MSAFDPALHPRAGAGANPGEFASKTRAQAAGSLEVDRSLQEQLSSAESAYIAAWMVHSAVTADKARDLVRAQGGAWFDVRWMNDGEGWYVWGLDACTADARPVELDETNRDRLEELITQLGGPEAAVGRSDAGDEPPFRTTEVPRRRFDVDSLSFVGPTRPSVSDAKKASADAYATYRRAAAAFARAEIRSMLPNHDEVLVDVHEDERDRSQLYCSVSTDSVDIGQDATRAEYLRMCELVADIGLDLDKVGTELWEVREDFDAEGQAVYALRLDS